MTVLFLDFSNCSYYEAESSSCLYVLVLARDC